MPDNQATTRSLDQPANLRSVSRELFAERIGWIVFAGIILSGALGLLGPGPLSHRKQESSDGLLSVEHYAVERYAAPATLTIRFPDHERSDRMVRIAISREFTDQINLEEIVPEPETTTMLSRRIVYAFRVSDLGDGGTVIIRYKHDNWGWRRFSVALVDGPAVEVTQFVCP
jgi:hypothetical protein